jgi:enterobactin synthetase component D / holo-[acyl-carrier protein] synthase
MRGEPRITGVPDVIEKILPAQVSCAESFGSDPAGELFPEEETLVARAVDKRRREFAAGRDCARRALSALGVRPAPLLPGYRGAPQWPDGIAGSITHCPGYCAAAVASTSDVLTIGLDAEPSGALPGGVLELVSLPAERARLRDLAAEIPGTHWDRLLFCAKEAVYKAWFPLTGRWLGFEDADITISPRDLTFTARLLVPAPVVGDLPVAVFAGRWLADDSLTMTAVTVAPQGR